MTAVIGYNWEATLGAMHEARALDRPIPHLTAPDAPPVQRLLPGVLIERQSTGPARGRAT
jgi:hypothetical protein